MHPNAALIETFYKAFQQRDAEAMAACYHKDIQFSDPVFPDLKGQRAGDMWRMLCKRGVDLRIEFRDIQADDTQGSAHWEAYYSFGKNKVHNLIDASFQFKDGLIIQHTDRFDLRRWASQALGLFGKMFGWTSFLQNQIRKNAAAGLDAFTKPKA